MFLSSCLLLVPRILATEIEVQIDNYVIKFENDTQNTLKRIEVIGDPSEELNLSGLSLEAINMNAFENIHHIKILNLSINSLSLLWENMFTSLTNLEQLHLSHNNIRYLTKPFVGLSNLKILDLSNNLIMNFRTSDFFGLTKSCVILLKGTINIDTISTELFENKSRKSNSFGEDNSHHFSDDDTYYCGTPIYIKICINDTKLISAEHYTKGEKLASGCGILVSHGDGVLSLSLLSIAEFQKGWYKIRDSSIHQIDLSSNHITRLTSEMLNDLPESISIVSIAHNNIERLEKGIIVNKHLREIRFTFDSIIAIEDDVFTNTNLTTLILSHNQLTDTKFAAMLPLTLTKIDLEYNEIAEISSHSFSKLSRLEHLVLNENYITEIHRDSLHGLSGLEDLSLMNSKLKKIEAGSFEALTALEVLNLKFNYITELESGVFADLKNIKKIFLGWNRLSNLTKDSFIDLPDSLEVLDLQFNALGNLKAGTFVNSPKYKLLLNNNNIENIEDGAFDLPHLQMLVLTHNLLSVINRGMFHGLKNLQNLWVDRNNIARIEEGAFENSRTLCRLFLSQNPIKRLENGTLYGLLQEQGCYVEVNYVPIEIIYGGVFARSVDSSFDGLPETNNTLLKLL